MDRGGGENGPPPDDEYGWKDETVEVHRADPPAPPQASPGRPAPKRPPRTFASDLKRLREHGWLPILAAIAAMVVVVVIVVVVVRGDGDSASPADVAPATTAAAETPTVNETPTVSETPTVTEAEATEPVTTATEASPAASVSESQTLRLGDEGESVRALQLALAQLDFFADEPDGIYGEQTEAAVQAFQESAGLTADGTAGPQTASAINEALARTG